jgi:hypothetical protein
LDGDLGVRYVSRFNTYIDSGMAWHGADSEQVGTRYVELYNNQLIHRYSLAPCEGQSDVNQTIFIGSRGGNLLLFNNQIPPLNTIQGGLLQSLVEVVWGIWANYGVPWSCWGTPMNPSGYARYPYPYQQGWGYSTGGTQAGNSGVYMDRDLAQYFGRNTGSDGSNSNYDNPGINQFGQTNDCGSTQNTTDYLKNNRDYYQQTSPFNGTSGTGTGPRSSRPATCTTGVGYWATDQGSWNTTNNASPGSNAQGVLDLCTATNTWTNAAYVPYTYPHPAVANLLTPVPH